MRNLKKVLSMTLALVMMLGMMTFAGAAEATKAITSADLKDMKDVENKEAVSLLVDLGVINGIKQADGTYKYAPTEGINRASFAKMIFTVMMNKGNPDVYKGANTGLSDVKGHWAEGYISYCVSTKIAAGDNNKKFNPDMPIQTVTAAKMLLTALGYDAKLSKYENDSLWAINIMKDAQEAGLLEGIALSANDALPRDAAALMIFNALTAKKVSPIVDRDQGVAYLTRYEYSVKSLGESNFGLYSVTTTATAIDKDGVITLDVTGLTGEAKTTVDKANIAKLKGTVDMVGNTVVIYAKGTIDYNAAGVRSFTYKSLYSTSITAAPATVIGTSMNGTAWDDLTTEGKDDFIVGVDGTTKYYYNGKKATALTTPNIVNVQNYVTKAGVIVEFLDTIDSTTVADVVRVTEKSVAEVTDKVLTKTDKDGNVTVKVPGVSATSAYVKCEGYEDLVKGDIVLYVAANDVVSFEKAKSVDGQISAVKTDKDSNVTYIVDGKAYAASELSLTKSNSNISAISAAAQNKASKFYLDDNGTVVAVLLIDETEVLTNYSVITEIALSSTSGLNTVTNVDAIVLASDGTTQQAKVASIDDFKGLTVGATVPAPVAMYKTGAMTTLIGKGANAVVAAGDKFYTLKAGKTADGTPANYDPAYIGVAATSAGNGVFTDKFYTYKTTKDGALELTTVVTADKVVVSAQTNQTITPGKATFATGYVGNAETIFVVKHVDSKGNATYKSTTGIVNAPKFTSDADFKAIATDGITTIVYIYDGAEIGKTTSNPVYFLDSATFTKYAAVTGKNEAYRVYDAIVDGAKGTVKVLESYAASVATGLFDATVNTDGIIEGLSAMTVANNDPGEFVSAKIHDAVANTGYDVPGTTAAKGGVVSFGGHAYTYAEDVKVFVIDGTDVSVGGIELVTSDKTDLYTAVMAAYSGDDMDILASLYIVKKAAFAPATIGMTKTSGTGTVTNSGNLKDHAANAVAITGAATTDTYTVTVPSLAGQTVTVTISGKGTLATTTTVGSGSTAATYALAALKADATIKVTVTVVMDGEENWTKSYDVAVTYAP